jgi:hypothetical protein
MLFMAEQIRLLFVRRVFIMINVVTMSARAHSPGSQKELAVGKAGAAWLAIGKACAAWLAGSSVVGAFTKRPVCFKRRVLTLIIIMLLCLCKLEPVSAGSSQFVMTDKYFPIFVEDTRLGNLKLELTEQRQARSTASEYRRTAARYNLPPASRNEVLKLLVDEN